MNFGKNIAKRPQEAKMAIFDDTILIWFTYLANPHEYRHNPYTITK